jgi:acyl transferase domain-containing protein
MRASEGCKARGGKRVLPLKVSGAFHSPLMRDAVAGLADALSAAQFKAGRFPVFANATAGAVQQPDDARRLLAEQLTAPVRWVAACKAIAASASGARYVEVGPGAVLAACSSASCRARSAPVSARADDGRDSSHDDDRSDGKGPFVTGSTRGIGLGVATALHAAGAKVAIVGRDVAKAQAVAATLGERAVGVSCDWRTADRSRRRSRRPSRRWARSDILVNNAGLTRDNLLLPAQRRRTGTRCSTRTSRAHSHHEGRAQGHDEASAAAASSTSPASWA